MEDIPKEMTCTTPVCASYLGTTEGGLIRCKLLGLVEPYPEEAHCGGHSELPPLRVGPFFRKLAERRVVRVGIAEWREKQTRRAKGAKK